MASLKDLKNKAQNKEKGETTYEKINYKTLMFKPTKESHRIRIVPNRFNLDDPIPVFKEHNTETFKPVVSQVFGANVTFAQLVSREMFGEQDPIVEMIKSLRKGGSSDEKEFAKKLYTKTVYYIFLVDRDKPEEGVKLWKVPESRLMTILAVINDTDPNISEEDGDTIVHEDFYDLETGNDLVIKFKDEENTFKKGTFYKEIESVTAKKAKKGFTDEQWAELEETYVDPMRLYFNTTNEKVEELLEAYINFAGIQGKLAEEEEDEESLPIEEDEEETPPPAPVAKVPVKKAPPTGKPAPPVPVVKPAQKRTVDEMFDTEDDSGLPF